MIKLVVFDFDGTIADTGPITVEIFQEISKRNGYPVLSIDEINAMRKLPIRQRLKLVSVPFRKVPGLMRQSLGLMKEKMSQSKPFDGIYAMLKDLHGKIPMIILSSNQLENIVTFFKTHKIDAFDDMVGGAKLLGKEKKLKKLLKAYQLSPREMLYVGDEIRDIVACQKAKVPVAAVTWGFDDKEGLKAHHPDYLIETPAALQTLIGSLI